MNNIGVIGTGYVGLVQGVVMAEFGMNVMCMDVAKEKIDKLNEGKSPIYEPGLEKMLKNNMDDGRLSFTTDMKETVEKNQVIFIAVGTPQREDGSANLDYIYSVAHKIGEFVNEDKVVVIKSTVPVGTNCNIRDIIVKDMDGDYNVEVVSNPEFLREGKALEDCMHPDRVVLGADSSNGIEVMKKIYDVFSVNSVPFLITTPETAEMIKYAANSFLAVKISFINEMALLADKVNADIEAIAKGMGMDARISPRFLNAGPGYGGSCFPKDTLAIVDTAKKNNEEMLVVNAAIKANEKQKRIMVERIVSCLKGKNEEESTLCVGVWGLSFKPDTSDMREAPALDIIRGLVKNGIRIKAYCPKGMEESKVYLNDIDKYITYCNDKFEAVKEADALVVITEWNQFRGASLEKIKSLLRRNILFDLRNIFAKNTDVRNLFEYYGVGCR